MSREEDRNLFINSFYLPKRYGYATYRYGEFISIYEGPNEKFRDDSFFMTQIAFPATIFIRYEVTYVCTELPDDSF